MTAGICAVMVILAGVIRFGLSGNEDTWICNNGLWIAHGNPQSPPPQIPCNVKTSSTTTMTIQRSDDMVTLYYQPRQCQQMSWDKWYASGGATFDPSYKPSYEEIIIAYYAQQGIQIASVERVESGKPVCLACDVCPTTHSLKVTAPSDQVGKLTLMGWMRDENTTDKSLQKEFIVP